VGEVQLAPRVSIERVRASEWKFACHMKLANGGVLFEHQCADYPRLHAIKYRPSRWRLMQTYFVVDRCDHSLTLEQAVAVLNGHEAPAMTEDEALAQRWPLPDMIALCDRLAEKRQTEEARDGLAAIKRVLEWLRRNEAKIKERVDGREQQN
jgi:hypothetical protein